MDSCLFFKTNTQEYFFWHFWHEKWNELSRIKFIAIVSLNFGN